MKKFDDVFSRFDTNHEFVRSTNLHAVQCTCSTGWAKLNGADAVSFVIVKHVLENFDNFWQVK